MKTVYRFSAAKRRSTVWNMAVAFSVALALNRARSRQWLKDRPRRPFSMRTSRPLAACSRQEGR